MDAQQSMTDFIKNVIITNDVPHEIKVEGLNILLEIAKENKTVRGVNLYLDGKWMCEVSRQQYEDLQTLISGSHKIKAIQALRNIVAGMGLKDAKNIVDSAGNFAQPPGNGYIAP